MTPVQGWLEKKSIFGMWTKKYFSLLFSKLSIYKEPSDSDPESFYELDSQTIVETSGSNDCIFKINIQKPKVIKLTLRASTMNEMIEWVFHIRRSAFANKSLYIDMFGVISLLGEGFYGKVTLCEKKDSKEIVAIKSVKKEKLHEANKICTILNEKMILASIHNPFIIKLKYAFQSSKYYYLALEYAPGGDLFHKMKEGNLPLNDIKLYIAELAIAIHELHLNHIIYRDMKPENVMIAKDGHLKLTDFGLATFCEPNQTKNTFCGTTEYIAPEVILNQGYGYRIDWWGIGILAFELLYKSTPFAGMNTQYIYQSILNKDPVFPKNEDPKTVSFISSLLNKDPLKRGGYRYIISSEFMSDIDFQAVYKKKIAPTFIPDISNLLDTSHFDKKYTKEKSRHSDFDSNINLASDDNMNDSFDFNCTYDSLLSD